jgi:hypothetical protein
VPYEILVVQKSYPLELRSVRCEPPREGMRSMHDFRLSHLSDAALLRDLAKLVVQDRATTASLLAHIAEIDARRLYVPAGYSSMHAYCVEKLRLSEDAAYKRIRAARAARRFPSLFEAVAEGRIHLAGVCLIAGHLTPENASELIEAAIDRKKFEIEAWLARRFPMAEPPAFVRPIHPRPQLETVPVRDEVVWAGAPGLEPTLSVDPARPDDVLLSGATANWPRGQLRARRRSHRRCRSATSSRSLSRRARTTSCSAHRRC